MAPKKSSLKRNLQFASHGQMKKSNKAHGISSFDDDADDEDALEMESNFALFSKQGPVQLSEMIEKDEELTDGEESNDAMEDDENADEGNNYSKGFVKDHKQAKSMDMTGSEDSHRQRDCRRNDTSARLHTSTELKQDLSTMSFEEIMRMQSKVGTKACKKLTHAAKKQKQYSEPMKRVARDRPQEISAKKPVSFLRKVGSVKEPILRDPRFDDISGEFKPELFGQTYKFISDIRQREEEMVRKKLKKVKSGAKKEELNSFLKRMENQKRNHQRQEQQREKELCYKRKQRVLVGDGHRPFYLKKSEKKKLQLAEKYVELKKSGKLENFLSKKRKRNAVKDRRKLP